MVAQRSIEAVGHLGLRKKTSTHVLEQGAEPTGPFLITTWKVSIVAEKNSWGFLVRRRIAVGK